MGTSGSGGQRAALKNRRLLRLTLGHFAGVVAEWAAVIGVLVYAFDQSGTTVVGFASLGLLIAGLAVAPFAGWLVDHFRPQRVRAVGMLVQVAGYGGAAAAAFAELPVAVVVACAMTAIGAVTTLRPSSAVLAPAHVRSSEELVVGNLWLWYCESVSVLAGPLVATALLAVGGPEAVLLGCAVVVLVGLVLVVIDLSNDPPAATGEHSGQGLGTAWRSLRGRPGLLGVLSVVWSQYVMVGALDIMLVVLARSSLDLGEAGPGILNMLFGAGALASMAVATPLLRRTRLAPVLIVGMGLIAASFVAFGLTVTVVVAVVVLPVLGLSRALLDGPSRLLLQRSAGPEGLGSLFAIREVCASSGLIVGSILAQVLLAVGDVDVALLTLGAFFAVVLLLVIRSLRSADDGADIPVVEMSLLRRLPMFAPLPSPSLEALARSATTIRTAPGVTVITQGEIGDRFYAVIEGQYDVTMSGNHVRVAERLSFFGEVALLADVPRTATVTALGDGALLAIERVDFLVAVTGTDSSRQAAWGVVRSLTLDSELPPGVG